MAKIIRYTVNEKDAKILIPFIQEGARVVPFSEVHHVLMGLMIQDRFGLKAQSETNG